MLNHLTRKLNSGVWVDLHCSSYELAPDDKIKGAIN